MFDRLETSLGEFIAEDAHVALACLATCTALAFAPGLCVARLIARPLDMAATVLESDDIAALAGFDSKDEIGRMAQPAAATVRRLEESAAALSARKQTTEASAVAMGRTARNAEEAAQRTQMLDAEAVRVAALVENSAACVTHANDSRTLVHINPAARRALARLGADMSPERLQSQPLARFFRDPRGQARFLRDEDKLSIEVPVDIGGESIELVLCAVHGDADRCAGTLVSR